MRTRSYAITVAVLSLSAALVLFASDLNSVWLRDIDEGYPAHLFGWREYFEVWWHFAHAQAVRIPVWLYAFEVVIFAAPIAAVLALHGHTRLQATLLALVTGLWLADVWQFLTFEKLQGEFTGSITLLLLHVLLALLCAIVVLAYIAWWVGEKIRGPTSTGSTNGQGVA